MKPNIYVVEDDPDISRLVRHHLEGAGFAVKLYPTYADAQNNIGVIWYDKKKFSRAIRAYQKAIKMRSDLAVSSGRLAALASDWLVSCERPEPRKGNSFLNRREKRDMAVSSEEQT